MATEPQSDGFVAARPEDIQASGSDGFVAARPEDGDGFTPARPQDIQDIGGPSVVHQGLDVISGRPQLVGAIKGLERTAGTIVSQIGQQYLGTGPDGPKSFAADLAQTTNPLASVTQALPERVKAPVRKTLNKGADWLTKNTDPNGMFEWGGNIGEMIGEITLLNEGGAGTRAAQVAKAAGKTGVGAEIMGEVESYATKLLNKAKNAKILEDNPTIARLVDAGIKYGRLAAHGATTAGIEGGAQTMAKTNDPNKALEGAGINALIGSVAEPVAAKAGEYLEGLRSGRIKPKTPGRKMEIPDRPVRPDLIPEPAPPKPPDIETPESITRPAAIQEERQPPKPLMPAPEPLADRPEMPTAPAPIPAPPKIEPEDVGPAPTPPEPFNADRAPGEQRFGELERDTARGVVESKLGTEEFTGDPDEAAQHILNLDRHVDSEEFQALPPDQQAEVLRTRQELIQRADGEGTSPEIIDQVGDMGDAAKAMRAKATEAYQQWGGEFTTLNNKLSKLRGKYDAASLQSKAEVETALDELAKSGNAGSNLERALHRSRFADSFILQDADDAFTNAWRGAERTGGLDPQALQRNWKSFVNNRGAERVRSVLGNDRFEAMNDFVNDFAGEKAADKAAQAAIEAEHRQKMAEYTRRVKEADTIAEAQQAALDAKHKAQVLAQQSEFERAKAEARQGVQQARVKDRLNARKRIQTHQQNISAWTDEVAKTQSLNEAKKVARDAELQTYRENVQARRAAKTARANAKEAAQEVHKTQKAEVEQKNQELKQEHAERVETWRKDKEAIEEHNRKLKSYGSLSRGVWDYLKENAMPVYVAGQMLHTVAGVPVDKAATIAGGLWVMKRIATSPAALKVLASATAVGAKPEVYIPIIAQMISGGEPPTMLKDIKYKAEEKMEDAKDSLKAKPTETETPKEATPDE